MGGRKQDRQRLWTARSARIMQSRVSSWRQSYRYATFCGYAVTASAEISRFADAGTVGSYALTAMKWASAEGLINGSGSKLDPKGSATRATGVTILARFCNTFCRRVYSLIQAASAPVSRRHRILPRIPILRPIPTQNRTNGS